MSTEILSLINAVTRAGVTLAWSILLVGLLVFGLKFTWLGRGAAAWRRTLGEVSKWPVGERLLALASALAAGLLFAVALASPANNMDSLLYHVTRVAHWVQNGSLAHYAASYHHQNFTPIWSETAIMHLMQLWGSDHPVNLVQWISMVISAVAIAGLASEMGVSRWGQWVAVVFGASAPMAILQATSTQNDYAVGMWIVVTFYFLHRLATRGLTSSGWILLGAAVGLGMLTKATYYPYMGLVILGAVWLGWRNQVGLLRLLAMGSLAGALVVVLNAGYWVRNLATYGTPFGPAETVSGQARIELDPRGLAARTVQHLALNFPTPSETVNERLVQAVRDFSSWIGKPNDRFRVIWSWNHEDLAGSPVHISVLALSLALAFTARGNPGRARRWYALAVIVSFLGFAWSISAGEFRARYQLPMILMGAPVVAVVADRFLSGRRMLVMAYAFLVLALPWLVFNQTRPVAGWRPRTRSDSVFRVSRETLLFVNRPELRDPYTSAVEVVESSGCQRIGLAVDSHDPEYTLWWLMGGPYSQMEIQVVRPLQSLRHLMDPEFRPCAVICTVCEGSSFRGLPLYATFGPARVYLQPRSE